MKGKRRVAKCPRVVATARRDGAEAAYGFGIMSYDIRPSTSDRKTSPARRRLREAAGGAAGAIGGAALGAMAGPPGAVAGAVIGGIVGALACAAIQNEAIEISERQRELDAELGISDGDIGAPNLEHPPSERGAFSTAVCGAEVITDAQPAEGPMPPAD